MTMVRRRSTGSHFLKGWTVYVHSPGGGGKGDEWKSKEEVERLISVVQLHGGSISRTPSSPSTTHIIIPFHPFYSPTAVLQIQIGESNLISLEHQQDWTDNDLIRKRRVLLRQEWLDECVRQDRVVGRGDEYGGWEIKGTHNPSHVNITPWGEPPPPPLPTPPSASSSGVPPNPFESLMRRSNSSGGSLSLGSSDISSDQGADPQSTDHSGSSKEVIDPLPQSVNQGKELATQVESQIPTDIMHSMVEDEEIKPIIKEEVEVEQDARPDTPDLPSLPQSRINTSPPPTPPLIASHTSANVASHDHPAAATTSSPSPQPQPPVTAFKAKSQTPQNQIERNPFDVDTPSSSSHMHIDRRPVEQDKGVFSRGILPLGFHVAGSVRERKFIEMVITRTGGGIIVSKPLATIYILPLSPAETPTDAEHLDVLQEVLPNLTQAVVSADWVNDCIEADRLLSWDKYRMYNHGQDEDTDMITPSPMSHERG
ncbi:hypothetical protein I302_108507 [Kwoniella bestiolae CBS 10118]|uniref:BRCT domain-containing protein n=1 Tax=Kwoniella bestiolae CBS 10118 TaxID=1296100 RepID=A0A1B9FVI3_9TREE|nr:hypothetical protein I302_07117 [Kwoniella bestiolae CBS 10118]OCF22776.1 hypothetical protein I302_07117 [Kwoniella bestiolae CBS 10118]